MPLHVLFLFLLHSSYLLPLSSEDDLEPEDDFDDEDLVEDEPDDFEPDPDEELLLPDTEVPRDDDVLDGALITLDELPEDDAEDLLTGPAGDDLLTCGREGVLV